jgi:hypothetical protein
MLLITARNTSTVLPLTETMYTHTLYHMHAICVRHVKITTNSDTDSNHAHTLFHSIPVRHVKIRVRRPRVGRLAGKRGHLAPKHIDFVTWSENNSHVKPRARLRALDTCHDMPEADAE